MVYTVTFNPALDYVMRVSDFEPGRVNRASEEFVKVGGKGINVSLMLKNLGVESVALGFAAGFTGEALLKGLAERGLRADFVRTEGLTRINVKLKSRSETDVNGRGPELSEQDFVELLKKLKALALGDVLVLSSAAPAEAYARILSELSGRGIRTAVDATGALLLETLEFRPFLVKPNHHELAELFQATLDCESDVEHCARNLRERGARNVLVSMAGEGALLVDESGRTHRLGAPRGVVVDSVGAGDSMVAGFLAGMLSGGGPEQALRLGVAAGSATAFSRDIAAREAVEKILAEL